MTVITLLLLTGLFEKLPEATLAAVVIAAVIELVDIPALRRLYGVYTGRLGRAYGVAARPDFIVAVAAMLRVMVFDTLPRLFIGIACSILLLIYRASRPRVAKLGKVAGAPGHYSDIERHPEDVSPEGVAVLRVESGLFFANSGWVRQQVREPAGQKGIHAVSWTPRTFRSSTSARWRCSSRSSRPQTRRRPVAPRAGHRTGPRRRPARERGPGHRTGLPHGAGGGRRGTTRRPRAV
jgi:MFS superfamily sulfate permease-like transporter